MRLISERPRSDSRKQINVPVWEKLLLTKEEASEYTHIGLNKLEELLKDARCPFVLYIGKKKLIKRKEFEKFLLNSTEI